MELADALTHKRRDVRALLDRLHELEAEERCLKPGPGFFDARQKLLPQIEQARQNHHRAHQELLQLQNSSAGTQTALL